MVSLILPKISLTSKIGIPFSTISPAFTRGTKKPECEVLIKISRHIFSSNTGKSVTSTKFPSIIPVYFNTFQTPILALATMSVST